MGSTGSGKSTLAALLGDRKLKADIDEEYG